MSPDVAPVIGSHVMIAGADYVVVEVVFEDETTWTKHGDEKPFKNKNYRIITAPAGTRRARRAEGL